MTVDSRKHKLIASFLGTALVMICCLAVLCLRGQAKETAAGTRVEGRALFISSYSYGWETVRRQIMGLQENLSTAVQIDYEFMNSERIYDETAVQLFHDGLKYRLSQTAPYDVVVLGDEAALSFALTYRNELFAGIPLVFVGITNRETVEEAVKDPLLAGVRGELFLESNIQLGKILNQQAVRVVALLDDTPAGQVERERFYQARDTFPDLKFEEINSSDFTREELEKELRGVSKYSILLYIMMTEDRDGNIYSNEEAIRMIKENASVPALCLVEAEIGAGALGGNVLSMYQSGKAAAQLVTEFIRDGAVKEQLLDSPNLFCIDQDVMKKYNLSASGLPSEVVYVNQKASFYEKNREIMAPVAILVLALLVVIGIVSMDNVRGRRLQKELEEAKTIMESASQHDFLTGLPNRSKFMEDLERLISEKTACTVIMLDIDDFKKINDSFGHTAGDEALQQVAARLKEMTSPILSAYRFAGDEFIMIQRSSQRKIVEKTAYQCRQLFAKDFVLCGEKKKIYGSIGLACYPDDTENLEQLIVCADDAMYQVKKNGKNDFAFYQKPTE